jgi:hypothetical protein
MNTGSARTKTKSKKRSSTSQVEAERPRRDSRGGELADIYSYIQELGDGIKDLLAEGISEAQGISEAVALSAIAQHGGEEERAEALARLKSRFIVAPGSEL